jgi:hypothetical protein
VANAAAGALVGAADMRARPKWHVFSDEELDEAQRRREAREAAKKPAQWILDSATGRLRKIS